MSDPLLRLNAPRPVARGGRPAVPVGRQLVEAGVIDQGALLKALNLQHYIDAPLGEILIANGDAGPDDVLAALSLQYGAEQIDLSVAPPAPAMAAALPTSAWHPASAPEIDALYLTNPPIAAAVSRKSSTCASDAPGTWSR